MLLLVMIFLHVIDDFLLQTVGFLAKGKQKDWWEENAPNTLYQHDYIVCLLLHSFSWAFMIMLPLMWVHGFTLDGGLIVLFIGNTIFHAITDDLKANVKRINLVQDQFIHMMQIVGSYIVFANFN